MEAMALEQVEAQVERLLGGLGCEVTMCDVGLEQSKPASLRNNVTYIVCAVVFNDSVTHAAKIHPDAFGPSSIGRCCLNASVCV